MSLSDWQTWILPAALALCVLIAMRHWRGLRERLDVRRPGDYGDDSDDDEAPTKLRGFRHRATSGDDDEPVELTRWRVEMFETAREIKAELDSKIAVLQVLIRDADEQRRRLEQAIDAGGRDTSTDNSSLRRPATLPTGESQELIYRLADAGRSCAAIAEQAGVPLGEVELLLSVRPKLIAASGDVR